MPYLTHPVRRLRDDPTQEESVTLLVTDDDGDRDALADALADLGTVEDRLRFGTIEVTVPQPAVATVCDLPGVARVETTNTLELDPTGAGEDVDLGDR